MSCDSGQLSQQQVLHAVHQALADICNVVVGEYEESPSRGAADNGCNLGGVALQLADFARSTQQRSVDRVRRAQIEAELQEVCL